MTGAGLAGRWVDQLNLDPRYRAVAGLGARVVRANQEQYMRAAWEQIGDVLSVNRQIRRAQLATKAASALYVKSLMSLPAERVLAIAGPVLSKLRASATTQRKRARRRSSVARTRSSSRSNLSILFLSVAFAPA